MRTMPQFGTVVRDDFRHDTLMLMRDGRTAYYNTQDAALGRLEPDPRYAVYPDYQQLDVYTRMPDGDYTWTGHRSGHVIGFVPPDDKQDYYTNRGMDVVPEDKFHFYRTTDGDQRLNIEKF